MPNDQEVLRQKRIDKLSSQITALNKSLKAAQDNKDKLTAKRLERTIKDLQEKLRNA